LVNVAGVSTVFVVTDSEDVWVDIASRVGRDATSEQPRRVVMVPRDYLAFFRKIARSFR
jgi:hypothetical protein